MNRQALQEVWGGGCGGERREREQEKLETRAVELAKDESHQGHTQTTVTPGVTWRGYALCDKSFQEVFRQRIHAYLRLQGCLQSML